jgi:shikimate dehydrogenase
MNRRRMLLGLIGANIMGSLSPALFTDAFAAAGIEGFYHLMDVDRLGVRRLAPLLGAIKTAGFAGANITYPFKQEVIALLDAMDPEAAQTGAVNTVAIAPDRTYRLPGGPVHVGGWVILAPRRKLNDVRRSIPGVSEACRTWRVGQHRVAG